VSTRLLCGPDRGTRTHEACRGSLTLRPSRRSVRALPHTGTFEASFFGSAGWLAGERTACKPSASPLANSLQSRSSARSIRYIAHVCVPSHIGALEAILSTFGARGGYEAKPPEGFAS
jgi:hypothetical protein